MITFLAHVREATEAGEMVEMMRQMMGRGEVGWGVMGPWMMGRGWNEAMGVGWLWLGKIFWLATWVLIILVLVALLRWLWKKGGEKWKK